MYRCSSGRSLLSLRFRQRLATRFDVILQSFPGSSYSSACSCFNAWQLRLGVHLKKKEFETKYVAFCIAVTLKTQRSALCPCPRASKPFLGVGPRGLKTHGKSKGIQHRHSRVRGHQCPELRVCHQTTRPDQSSKPQQSQSQIARLALHQAEFFVVHTFGLDFLLQISQNLYDQIHRNSHPQWSRHKETEPRDRTGKSSLKIDSHQRETGLADLSQSSRSAAARCEITRLRLAPYSTYFANAVRLHTFGLGL